MTIETNITKMFGIKHPIFSAAMGPFYTSDLCIAVSEAGGLGVLSHTNMYGENSTKAMMTQMEKVIEHTDKPFGFNIRTGRLQIDAKILSQKIPRFILNNPKLREQCIYALTSAGSSKVIKTKTWAKLKESGSNIKHFHVAPALWLADKCVASNVDGLVVTGGEGGGHQSYEGVSTLVVLQQVAEKYPDVPIIACGGFATGRGLAAALSMGAGAVAMGSRFIASKDSEFHENYKNVVPPAKAQDTVMVTGTFGPIRLWRNNYSLHHGLIASKEEKIAEEKTMDLAQMREANKAYEVVYEGDINEGAVLLGQSIGIIKSVEKVSDIVNTVISDAENHLKKGASLVK